jgi:hypothetical protein
MWPTPLRPVLGSGRKTEYTESEKKECETFHEVGAPAVGQGGRDEMKLAEKGDGCNLVAVLA